MRSADSAWCAWCFPTVINGIKCVIVSTELRDYDVMAWDFVISFAKDNNLEYGEACVVPEVPK